MRWRGAAQHHVRSRRTDGADRLGRAHDDESYARIEVSAADDEDDPDLEEARERKQAEDQVNEAF